MRRAILTSRLSLVALSAATLLVGGGLVMLQVHAKPFVRNVVETPVYTVGDADDAAALSKHRRVTKLGPLPLGVYAGGLAFSSPKEARDYLRQTGHDGDGWGVYELSGDFDLDTREVEGRHHITRTLLVVRRVDGDW